MMKSGSEEPSIFGEPSSGDGRAEINLSIGWVNRLVIASIVAQALFFLSGLYSYWHYFRSVGYERASFMIRGMLGIGFTLIEPVIIGMVLYHLWRFGLALREAPDQDSPVATGRVFASLNAYFRYSFIGIVVRLFYIVVNIGLSYS